MPKNNGKIRKEERRVKAKERQEVSRSFSDSRYVCKHLHTSPFQFQRCMGTRNRDPRPVGNDPETVRLLRNIFGA